jgi:ureidoglycolate lyase
LVTTDEVTKLGDRRIWLQKNDVVRQDSSLHRMIFNVPRIIAHLTEFMRLLPGDLILTGTPHGVAYNKADPDYLQPGDVIRCGIDEGDCLPRHLRPVISAWLGGARRAL